MCRPPGLAVLPPSERCKTNSSTDRCLLCTCSLVNSRVGLLDGRSPNFPSDVEESSPFNFFHTSVAMLNPFRNASAINGGEIDHKLVALGTSLGRPINEGQIDRLHPYVYRCWKFGEDGSATFWDNWSPTRPSQYKEKKKKQQQNIYLARQAGRAD